MRIRLFSRALCGWCQDAKKFLHDHHLAFEEIDVGRDPAAHEEMVRLSGQRYVPTIEVDGHVLADFDTSQLEEFLKKLGVKY